MTTPKPIRLFMSLCFFAILATAAAIERPAFAQCESVNDAKIVSDIYAKLKGDKALAGQLSHINVTSTNYAVKFQGWTDTRKDYDRAVGFANMTCVRVVNVNDFSDAPPAASSQLRAGAGGCASGTKPCGDICIPEGDVCNIP